MVLALFNFLQKLSIYSSPVPSSNSLEISCSMKWRYEGHFSDPPLAVTTRQAYAWSYSVFGHTCVRVLLPGKSHGRRSLEGYSPWGCWGLDTTGRLHFHFSLSCIGEGNGNPLHCSCLENPRARDGEAWWAAVYVVAQSRTRLKWLSSSSVRNNP